MVLVARAYWFNLRCALGFTVLLRLEPNKIILVPTLVLPVLSLACHRVICGLSIFYFYVR